MTSQKMSPGIFISFLAIYSLMAPLAASLMSQSGHASELLLEHSSRPLQAESTMEALDPWETPIGGFFVRSHLGLPDLSAVSYSHWTLRIDGLVDHPLSLTMNDLKKMRSQSLHAVLECSGNGRGQQKPVAPGVQWQRGAVGNAQWDGVSLSEILKKAGVQPSARFLRLEGADKPMLPSVPGFVRSISLEKAQRNDSLIALRMNREPIPILHGGPLRVILPGWYGENWMKWVTHITLTEKEDPGYYMKKGYRIPFTPVKPGERWDSSTGQAIERLKVQSWITSPTSEQVIKAEPFTLSGKAFSGERTISKVEVSLDQGKTWLPTVLEPPHATGGWQEFHAELNPTTLTPPATWYIISRATDSAGDQQPLEQVWNPGGYVRNAADHITLKIAEKSQPNGHLVMVQRCLICHAPELIESQRLTAKQWEGTVKKMEGFGAQLSDDERTALLNHLAQFSPDLPPPQSKMIGYEKQIPKMEPNLQANKKRGASLFQNRCAVCHGEKGEGKIGPRLIGRFISDDEYWKTVTYGKRTMPAFGAILKKQEIADVRKYLTE